MVKQLREPRSALLWAYRSLIVIGLVVIVAGVWIISRQTADNQTANRAAAVLQKEANAGAATGDNPSTVKPGPASYDSYQVAADLARYIEIPAIQLRAVVRQVGLTHEGAIGAPNNVFDTAWYSGSAKPGQAGATLIDGHVSSWTMHGVFYNLKRLQPGDAIIIQRGDNRRIDYTVRKIQIYDADKINMKAVLAPINPAKSGLNLITCTGVVQKGTSDFNQRVVVFAEQD